MVQKEAVFNIANQTTLPNIPITDGSMTYTSDTNNIYFDIDSKRVRITDIVIINDSSSKLKDSETTPVKNPIEKKLYVFTKSEDALIYYIDERDIGKWIFVSSYNSKVYTIEDTFKDENGNDKDIFIENASIGSLIIDSNENIGVITSKNIETNKITVSTLIDKSLQEAFVSKGTFSNINELINNIQNYETGNVLKYVGETKEVLNIVYSRYEQVREDNLPVITGLEPIQNGFTIENIVNEEGIMESYYRIKFALDNASYFVKPSDTVDITYSFTNSYGVNSFNYTLSVDSVKKDQINLNNKTVDVIETLIKVEDALSLDDNFDRYIKCEYICKLNLYQDDRIIKLDNGWDKLSAASKDNHEGVINADLLDGKRATDFVTTTKMITNINIDDLTSDGFYDLVTITSAKPLPAFVDVGTGRSLLVKSVKGNSTFNSCHQFLTADGSFNFYVRTYHDGNWSDWNIIMSSINLTNYAENEELERLQYYGDKDIVPSDSSYFSIVDDTVLVGISNTGRTQTKLVIPYTITTVVGNAFQNCTSLTSVIIPNNIDMNQDGIFDGCTSLTSIVLPDKTTRIGNQTFLDCTSLTSINIPDSVTSIGYNAFGRCTSLTSISIPKNVTSIDNTAFNECTNLKIYCEQGSYADTYAKENNIPVTYVAIKKESLNIDSNFDADTVDGKHSNEISINTIEGSVDSSSPLNVSYLPTGIYVAKSGYIKYYTDGEYTDCTASPHIFIVNNYDDVGSDSLLTVIAGDSIYWFRIDFDTHNLSDEQTYAFGSDTNFLNRIKSVDGSGSGIDSDKLDGKHSTDFVYNDTTSYTSVLSLPSQTGIYYVSTSEITGTNSAFAITKFYYNSTDYTLQASNCTDGTMYFGSRSGNTITWKKVGAGVEVLTADPTNAVTGDIWIRSDLS